MLLEYPNAEVQKASKHDFRPSKATEATDLKFKTLGTCSVVVLPCCQVLDTNSGENVCFKSLFRIIEQKCWIKKVWGLWPSIIMFMAWRQVKASFLFRWMVQTSLSYQKMPCSPVLLDGQFWGTAGRPRMQTAQVGFRNSMWFIVYSLHNNSVWLTSWRLVNYDVSDPHTVACCSTAA